MSYDSTQDTSDHIDRVRALLAHVANDLLARAAVHDTSKLEAPEKTLLDRLETQTNLPIYGSAEERARFDALAEFRTLHYAKNSHHPEHYEQGIAGMSLLDILEMLCDWHAAGARHVGGDIWQSLEFNRKRFNISPEMYVILVNTVKELGW